MFFRKLLASSTENESVFFRPELLSFSNLSAMLMGFTFFQWILDISHHKIHQNPSKSMQNHQDISKIGKISLFLKHFNFKVESSHYVFRKPPDEFYP